MCPSLGHARYSPSSQLYLQFSFIL
jgi:aquaglyceroporin related protein